MQPAAQQANTDGLCQNFSLRQQALSEVAPGLQDTWAMPEKHHDLQRHIFVALSYFPDVFAHTQILVFCLAADSESSEQP